MKKILSTLLAGAMLLPNLAFSVFADNSKLPFDLKAPKVSVKWMEGNDSPTSMSFAASMDDSMMEFISKMDEARADDKGDVFFAPYDFEELNVCLQIDWALDDVNDPVSGWHYKPEYWDGKVDCGLGHDAETGDLRVSEWDAVEVPFNNGTDTVQEFWIMRGVPNDDRWNGNPETKTPGVKDQLNPDQYTYDVEEEALHIDFTKHTAYFRARLIVTTYTSTVDNGYKFYYSDWSETCGYGKDIKAFEPITEKDLPKPEISELRLIEPASDGDTPCAGYKLAVTDEFITKVTDIHANGGYVYIETEARLKGDENWIPLNGERDIKPGEHLWELTTWLNEGKMIPDGSELEIRCRYYCEQNVEGIDVMFSEYSDVLTFKTTKIEDKKDPTPTEVPDDTPTPTEHPAFGRAEKEKKEEKKCSLCGFCPQPLGLCIFIWIAIIVVVAVVVVIIIVKTRKKDNGQKE